MKLKPGYQKALDEIGASIHHVDHVKDAPPNAAGEKTGKLVSSIVATVTTPTGTVLATESHANAEVAVHKAIEVAAAKRNVIIAGGDIKNVDPKQVASLEKTVADMQKQMKVMSDALANKNGGDEEGDDGYDFTKHNVGELRELATKAGIEGDVATFPKVKLVKLLAASGWKPE